MSLFVPATFLLWQAALSKRYLLQGIVLFLLPFIRPEGFIIAGLYPLLLWGEAAYAKRTGRRESLKPKVIVCCAGFAGILCVFGVNYALTGIIQFDSIREKGFFLNRPFLTALMSAAGSVLSLIKGVMFGLENNSRQYLYIPVMGGTLIIIGLLQRPWGKKMVSFPSSVETWWLLSIVASFGMVAVSGMQGIHNDRYLAWMIPLLLIFLYRGIDGLPVNGSVKDGLCVIFILFHIIAFPFFVYVRTTQCADAASEIHVIRKLYNDAPEKTPVGVFSGSGITYLCPQWHVINLGGVTSPHFRDCNNMAARIKTLQYLPELRFKMLLKRKESDRVMVPLVTGSTIVKTQGAYKTSVIAFEIDWEPLDRGRLPLQQDIVDHIPKTVRLIDKLDIANPDDERSTAFTVFSRDAYADAIPVLTDGVVEGKKLVDAACPVLGAAFFRMKTEPGKDPPAGRQDRGEGRSAVSPIRRSEEGSYQYQGHKEPVVTNQSGSGDTDRIVRSRGA